MIDPTFDKQKLFKLNFVCEIFYKIEFFAMSSLAMIASVVL